jgi:hypothetical protein
MTAKTILGLRPGLATVLLASGAGTPVGLPVAGLVETERLARRIEGLNLCTATRIMEVIHGAKPRLPKGIHKTLQRHDQLRDTAFNIYKAKIDHLLNEAEAEVMANVRKNYKPIPVQAVLRAADPKAAANLNFDLKEFSSKFSAAMQDAAQQSFQVTSRGLLNHLGQHEKATDNGVIRDFINKRANKISGCPDEIFKDINSELKEGTQQGETMKELAERIQHAFANISLKRAITIAATESQSVYGTAQADAIDQAGFEQKQWVNMDDDLVRPSHVECGDQGPIGVDEEFVNGLMFPGDPDGEADEVINCRCYLVSAGDVSDEYEP